ncbi:MAG TPA: hypothetical protein VES66_05815 [Terriglobales bacterium]|nr:hypothetical protein [Terriglobales bacterium]
MTNRAVQDEVIRYLADASVRAQRPRGAPISSGEAAKAAQFAHFLARRYYRDRLARSFRYSHRLRMQTGRIAEEVVDGTEFDRFLTECVMGSLESAQRVGEMARAHLAAAPQPGPWWPELLDYEYAYFLQAATSEPSPRLEQPTRGVSAVCLRFTWRLPQMLLRLRAGVAIGDELQQEATLLFSRTREGRIYVVEVEPQLENIFLAVDGSRTPEQIAAAAGVVVEQALRALAVLNAIGAVVMVNPAH